jgi:hypothetical protein
MIEQTFYLRQGPVLVRASIPYSSGPPVAGIDGPLGGTGFVTVYYGAGCPRP